MVRGGGSVAQTGLEGTGEGLRIVAGAQAGCSLWQDLGVHTIPKGFCFL